MAEGLTFGQRLKPWILFGLLVASLWFLWIQPSRHRSAPVEIRYEPSVSTR